MTKFGKSQTVNRVEDPRLLKGEGQYVEDSAPDGALFGWFLRSPIAHADITELDVSDARAADGVHAVITAADMEAAGVVMGLAASTIQNRDGTMGAAPERPALAKGRVRFVGEPVALILAETLEQAQDAAEMVLFDFDEIEPALSLSGEGTQIHPEAPGNIAFDWELGDAEATQAAFDSAAHVVSTDVTGNRVMAVSLEPRGMWANWDGAKLTVGYGGQGVWGLKRDLARHLSLEPEQVQVLTPDVGGGFGMKAFGYPEYIALTHAAMVLGKPVRWMADRTESMLSDNGGRALQTRAELAFDENHKVLAYRVHTRSDLGAYNSQFAQYIQSNLFARVLTGAYDVPVAHQSVQGVYTNTTQVDAYRGAGRPEAIYVLERAMDNAAKVLGVDDWELRRKNFIPVANFPYKTVSGELYDVGDFRRVLGRVEAEADRDGFAARRTASENAGKLRGMGLSYYVESILGDDNETTTLEFTDEGRVNVYVGTQSTGQGHETVYAQYVADETGIPVELVDVVQGDSDRIAHGGGTGGSRSVTVQTGANYAAVQQTIAAFTPIVADAMGVEGESVSFDDGTFRSPGSNQTPSMLDAAEMARKAGREDLLRQEASQKIDGRSFPNGAHVAEVEIDRETGQVEVVRYTVTDDFGNMLHPTLVEGQVHGGVVQGIGQAITERVVFDEDGQLLTATFMDYGMPRADNVPMMGFTTEPVPSTANMMGMKGCGEAGTVGALGAVGNAVLDALWPLGVRQADMPFTPLRVWEMMQEAGRGDAQ
ncbi:xanthine dehydrogenase [Actibacterium mucosum KCTC 23349]|uniref:Xanthine dehydrogenase n=1 Tax=Actibacterium mucosum KCTC 23349 TaxID=1454373 RepID=A0A037ZLL9_9RHOB|nr:xanthine dehydrogenase family protein molybdopterin-binding subunit [Actibacterium mucosum]KAJ56544.1 xanthine dehydrogenase [Actibacterium mucosum KCTC 23349]